MSSPEGYLLHINAGDKTATITIGGKKFPIVVCLPMQTKPYRLQACTYLHLFVCANAQYQNTEDEAKVRGRGLRRKLSFAGALMTSGSFTMMAASGGL